MRDRNDVDPFGCVVNDVQDAIIADAKTVGILPVQFLYAKRTRVLLEGQELVLKAITHGAGKDVKFFLGRTLEDDLIAHEERWPDRSARY